MQSIFQTIYTTIASAATALVSRYDNTLASNPRPRKIRRLSTTAADPPASVQSDDETLAQYPRTHNAHHTLKLPDEIIHEILSTGAMRSREFALALSHTSREKRTKYGLPGLLATRAFDSGESLSAFLDGLIKYRIDVTQKRKSPARNRANFLHSVLIGDDCDREDVVDLLDKCLRVSHIALPFHLFYALFNPSSDAARHGHRGQRDTRDRPRFAGAVLQRHDLEITILDEVLDHLWHDLRAELPSVSEGLPGLESPIQRVTRLVFAHSPPPILQLHHLFTRLTHIALPEEDLPDLGCLFERNTIQMVVILTKNQDDLSSTTLEEVNMWLFPHGRVFCLPYEPPASVDGSCSPTLLQNWKDATRGPDIWAQATKHMIELTRQSFSTLEFVDSEDLSDFVDAFEDPNSLWESFEFGSEAPASIIQDIWLDPSTDDVPCIAQTLNRLSLRSIALSTARLEELVLEADMAGQDRSVGPMSALHVTILDSDGMDESMWPPEEAIPVIERVTRIYFHAGVSLGFSWASFPSLKQVAVAAVDPKDAFGLVSLLKSLGVARVIFVPETAKVGTVKRDLTRLKRRLGAASDLEICISPHGSEQELGVEDCIDLWDSAVPV